MFDSALAFERYRLEVVRRWPDSAVKDKLLASIEYSLRRNAAGRERLDSRAGSGESTDTDPMSGMVLQYPYAG